MILEKVSLPGGVNSVGRLVLCPEATPLMATPSIGARIGGPALWMKRDDLIPFGLGGNKIRGLEFMIADAIEMGAATILTGAGPLSNHVRATVAAATYAGLRSVVIYWGDSPRRAQGNHLLTEMMGAEIHFTHDLDRSSVDRTLAREADRISAAGATPYVIPRGGACPLGVLGHVQAVREVLVQAAQQNVRPDLVTLAVGSGGTVAGWLLGSRLFEAPWRVVGISVSRPATEVRFHIKRLFEETADMIGYGATIDLEEIEIHDQFIGDGYGIPSPLGAETLREVFNAEGILLDPTYTAKAFGGYTTLVQRGDYREGAVTLFLHTGGLPSVFVNHEASA